MSARAYDKTGFTSYAEAARLCTPLISALEGAIVEERHV
jgi:hypothetical protein